MWQFRLWPRTVSERRKNGKSRATVNLPQDDMIEVQQAISKELLDGTKEFAAGKVGQSRASNSSWSRSILNAAPRLPRRSGL